jgi:hypothetical protein
MSASSSRPMMYSPGASVTCTTDSPLAMKISVVIGGGAQRPISKAKAFYINLKAGWHSRFLRDSQTISKSFEKAAS